ncbi:MAG TPA: HEAT repeat domain-containing protein [Bryobacteraceae bacterium]|nr:HEAT repeat domain-containing protein [Bryobacteraceae bacterium]
MILSPQQYPETSTPDLLTAASRGQVGIDHRWLRVVTERGEAVIADLVAFLDSDKEQLYPIDDVLLDIARHLKSPATVPFLHEFVRQYSYEFDDELIDAFLAIGPAALEPLLAIYEESNGEAVEASYTLAALGIRDQRIFDLLVKELETHPFEAAISLARYGDEAARPVLQNALSSAPDDNVKGAIEEALKDLGTAPPEEIEPFDIWAKYPEEDIPHFGGLEAAEIVEFLDSPEPVYRAYAATALGLEQFDDTIRDRLLTMAQTDTEPGVRGACWEALEAAFEENELVAAALQARFADSDVPVEERGGVLVALAQISREDAAVRRAILKLAGDPAGRAQAIKAMWHSMDSRFGDEVAKYLDDPDLDTRRQAIAAVGWLGVVSQLSRIQKAMQDEDVRDAALYAYVLAAPGETSPAHMGNLLRKVEELSGGLSDEEGMIVRKALDDRLQLNGHEPRFLIEEGEALEAEHHHEDAPAEPVASATKPGRNDPCPCGSGKKFKKCCGA